LNSELVDEILLEPIPVIHVRVVVITDLIAFGICPVCGLNVSQKTQSMSFCVGWFLAVPFAQIAGYSRCHWKRRISPHINAHLL
jgi:hypothetical protein